MHFISVPLKIQGDFLAMMESAPEGIDYRMAGIGSHTTGEGSCWVGEYRKFEIYDTTGKRSFSEVAEVADRLGWEVEHMAWETK